MSSRLLCNTFLQQLVRHERHSNQTSSLFRILSRSARTSSMGKSNSALMMAGLCLSGGLALGAATYRNKLHKMFSLVLVGDNFVPSQLILKRSLCAQAINPKSTSERDLPGWTPRTRELYKEYQAQLLQCSKGWTEMLNSVDRERNVTGFTLNHPEVGATFEYVMFFNEEEKKSITIVQFGEKVQGPPGHVHGGAIATVGDACAGVLIFNGLDIKCVTANLSVNYKKPLPVNSTIIIETVVDKIEGVKYYTTSIFKSPDGSIIYDTVTTLFIDISKYLIKKGSLSKSSAP
ncbi:acyl-coenzyme A thioesterase THEM4 [Strongylocentrotus purpuratus]|uniref:Acyl-coenzyme A thioesterase THEM4 n=1 Tax=Strongylocentrotus purpuratus TaxID=7668 RepID=A0A7M7HQ93_STRPU|nr:acyl-coenzyme A thioesterase THEM4 [Strongylocentrotus purpuratus]XP_011677547.2 acyl-coenzyme A thioesterase THEM4 [Strongylocentrotus purpuratus]XP_011677548.2 acyl-coenzyme A thioesterase THEM4 [Strongylocentrotus purpuratus]XP_011677549.2 acyl-coenzyme A thioesterase THEM4 [Strongylocentrotus purpuratus]XP_011677550.2 acyl-coenzyme A thioesterase THEM4 [Strongylocentrotus purpuratus]XP_030842598.1 acyl-coenzyme A thioesterase THEM4 [Strongylocentrotus purpuratus]XP_030842600.1 acyl-coe